MPRNIGFLYRHVDLNGARNITIFPLACADRITTELFYHGANNALGHLAEENRHQQNDDAILVSTTTLDAAVERLGISPDVIKIDVEGAELRVLKGAKDVLTRDQPSLLLSVHSAQLREACATYLDGFDYRLEPLNGNSMEVATEFFAQPET
jgi:FkbM family methyltransferase